MGWKQKLTSRKFWLAIADFVTMLIIALGGGQETATQITALIMAGAGVVAWIVAEGMADAAGAAADIVVQHVDDSQPPDIVNTLEDDGK